MTKHQHDQVQGSTKDHANPIHDHHSKLAHENASHDRHPADGRPIRDAPKKSGGGGVNWGKPGDELGGLDGVHNLAELDAQEAELDAVAQADEVEEDEKSPEEPAKPVKPE